MSDPQFPEALRHYLDTKGIAPRDVTPLTGDASDRRYFRAACEGQPSILLALYASPFDPATLPFLNVAELFAQMPVPVPRVLDAAGTLGVLALQDLGDVTLQVHLEERTDGERLALYERALAHLATIQERGEALRDERFLPYRLAFDEEKLTWELDFFLTHFLEQYRGAALSVAAREALRMALRELAAELAALPRVLCHRDYHSRNLMVHAGDLFIIDLQDARMGPATYDLVSLLRDSYVELPEDQVATLVMSFATRTGRDPRRLAEQFDVMALQRNLKALGTFGFQAVSRNNPRYGQYVPRTLGYVRHNLQRNPRFARIGGPLADLVPELR